MHYFYGIDVAAEGLEDELVFSGAGFREAEGRGKVAGTEACCYSQGEDAGVPEVGPADSGLEGEGNGVMRMVAGGEEVVAQG